MPADKPQPSITPPLSRRAAATAQEIETLEAELAQALAYGRQQEQRAEVAEASLREAKSLYQDQRAEMQRVYDDQMEGMRKELGYVRHERDHFQEEHKDMRARLNNVAQMLVAAPLKEEPKKAAETAGLKAIESALHGEETQGEAEAQAQS